MSEQLSFPFMNDELETVNNMIDMVNTPPSTEPCYVANPVLWSAYCVYKNRPNYPSEVWSELDVYDWLVVRRLYVYSKSEEGKQNG